MKKRIFLMRPTISERELFLIKKVLHSKNLTEGNVTKTFEKKVAEYVNSKYAIATTSATTALHACFMCLNVKNKRVLVSDFTYPATIAAIILAGGNPILIDVDKETMNTTSEIIQNSYDETIDFICPVSIFGNPLEKNIYNLNDRVTIIEDAAPSLGARLNNQHVGSLADVTCFSFHPRKIITTGEGGIITTNNKKLAQKLNSFKLFGKINEKFVSVGTNYKLSDILSALGVAQIVKIEKIIQKRRYMAKIYDELISKIDFLETQKPTKNGRHVYQSYVCHVTRPKLRDKLRKNLEKNNIESQIGTFALHCLPAFKKIPKKGHLTNSELLYNNTISLPLHEELSSYDIDYICKILKNSV